MSVPGLDLLPLVLVHLADLVLLGLPLDDGGGRLILSEGWSFFDGSDWASDEQLMVEPYNGRKLLTKSKIPMIFLIKDVFTEEYFMRKLTQ